ncbi:hypothetical protein BC827DRAFT_632483 [Russula dissimulans]|nr:hypothetical protein BC827DRAFT_632483 [Russula dissimulans]
MKRGAEKQLSKDDNLDDEVEEVQTGFQVAKESEMAKREIRGLPKRRSPAVAPGIPPASSPAPAASQKFGSFAGFGAVSGAATPFTFTPSPLAGPSQKPADAPAVSESASNATKKFASFLGPSSTAGAKPLLSSSSSETPKADASGDTDEIALKYYTSLRGLNSSFLSAVTKAIESDPFIDVADILGQYKKHRISAQHDYDGKSSHVKTQSAPSKPSIAPAPFTFSKPATSAPATMPVPPSGFAGFAATSSPVPATGSGFTPSPAAPASTESSPFSFASAAPASSDSKPPSAVSSSPFSGFSGAASSSSPFKPPASLASKESESTPSLKPAFSLGAFSSTGPTPSAFPFGGGGGGTSGSSTMLFSNPPKTSALFGSDKAAAEDKDKEKDRPTSSTPTPFAFALSPGTRLFGDTSSSLGSSGSIFGSATATKSVEDRDKDKEKDKAPSLPPPGSIFGGPFGSPTKPSPFTFGAAGSTAATTTTPTPAQFGFGVAPGSSEGSTPPKAGSIGFSFGSPSRPSSSQSTTPSASTAAAAAAAAAPVSVFGGFSSTLTASAAATVAPGGAPVPASTAGSTTPASTAESTPAPPPVAAATRGDTPATEGSVDEDGLARTMSPGLHGGEGDGEEGEETTFTVKAKVFKFTADSEGQLAWSDMGVGAFLSYPSLACFSLSPCLIHWCFDASFSSSFCIGMLRLKRHRETNTRRVILRSISTGKIIINFRIYPGLQPKRTAKTIAFTGHITSPGKETQTAQYRLRVGTEDAAKEVTEALEREVRLMQTESSPST